MSSITVKHSKPANLLQANERSKLPQLIQHFSRDAQGSFTPSEGIKQPIILQSVLRV